MISTKNLKFFNFKKKISSSIVKKELRLILSDKENQVINSLKLSYKYSNQIFQYNIFQFFK